MTNVGQIKNGLRAELLSVAQLSKSYATPVLKDVNFDLNRGEVHALVGENGAGKSTLAKIVAGLTSADAGEMQLRGERFAPKNKLDAERRGVRLVLQELNLIGNLTVAENLFFDRMLHRFGWIDYKTMNAATRKILAQVGLDSLEASRMVKTLGVGHQQLIEIAAGLFRRCDVLILDEPTAALTDREVEMLFGEIRKLQTRGVGIIFISHRLEEVREISDRVTILRDGQVVATRRTQEISMDEMVRLMVGRELGNLPGPTKKPRGAVALRVEGLRASPAVQGVSFEARRGEILGFAGLMGAGRTETMRALFGADRAESGQIFLRGSNSPARIRSPRDAVRQGLALLTEDRKTQGLLLPLATRVNVTLMRLRAGTTRPSNDSSRLSRWGGWIRRVAEIAEAFRWISRLTIRCTSIEQPVAELSGGNQQKVILAKWLSRECDILIFDEPTRGIDVGAKFEIYQLLRRLTDEEKAILIVSSDLKELLSLCDRIAVMSAGRIAAVFERGAWSQDQIMAAALSGHRRGEISHPR